MEMGSTEENVPPVLLRGSSCEYKDVKILRNDMHNEKK